MLYCRMCGKDFTREEVDDPDATYVRATSWVTGEKLQSPVLRTHDPEYRAHKECIEKTINGVPPDQNPIPGLEEV